MFPTFHDNVVKIMDRIDRHIAKGEAFDLQNIFQRATLDAIASIAFGEVFLFIYFGGYNCTHIRVHKTTH